MESEFVNLNEFMGVVGTVVKKKKTLMSIFVEGWLIIFDVKACSTCSLASSPLRKVGGKPSFKT